MASGNITRTDAQRRSESVTAHAYRVTIDLTGAGLEAPEKNFYSTTEIGFTSHGPATYADLIADRIFSCSIDDEDLDTTGFGGYRLPLPELSDGEHVLKVEALCRYSRTGEGLHRFVDPADQRVYLYSQFETADARRMFANFEQPDQKATFEFNVLTPSSWTVFSNSMPASQEQVSEEVTRWKFAPTPKISTYITAVVAGEYHVDEGEITTAKGTIPARVACRQSMAEHLDADVIRRTAQLGFEVFENAFGVPYAFDSYDQIFVPEFNFGAMENAGCVTFRDEYVFRSRVTARELEARDNTILHELAHMWFGDLVTMKWWDDLWLNESFAEWASHFAADKIAAQQGTGASPWTSFANERKAWAYNQDQLSTTHPIAADMSDLEKVEQNFDGITYAKGASVLKLLVSFVGEEAFTQGVGNYFRKHAYGNTQLNDLLSELEAASGKDLSWFTGEWLESAGVNTLQADFDIDEQGNFTRFVVQQTSHQDFSPLRTHRLGIGIYTLGEDGLKRTGYVESDISGESTEIPELVGQPRGDVVLLNDGDLTYAKVRLDEQSQQTLVHNIAQLHDPLARAVVWTCMWDAVRDAQLAPQDYIDLVLAGFASETDMAAAKSIVNKAIIAATNYMAPELRSSESERLTGGLARLLQETEPGSDSQLVLAQGIIAVGRSADAADLIRGWLRGEEVPEGLAVDNALRWAILASLARTGAVGVTDIQAELERDNTITGAEKAAAARAALAQSDEKADAWQRVMVDDDVPNETLRQTALGFWQYGQDEVLSPYVEKYFEQVTAIANQESPWRDRGYARIGAVLRFMFPDTQVDQALVDRTRAWLAEHPDHDQTQRGIKERLDDAERALQVQARSRQAR